MAWIIAALYGLISGLGIFEVKSPVVTTTLGPVQGLRERSREGIFYYKYLGIPYGTAQRFEESIPAPPWTDVLSVRKRADPCKQLDYFSSGIIYGEEDCLKLNIYAPQADGPLMPVIVFFHGGGFVSGDPSDYGGKYFMDHEVLMITIAYRLGPLGNQGFLSTGDDVIRGNFGMKDQVLGLKWIQNNIEKFHGDPQQVTLMGQSAGAACAHLHIFSPLSKGLFHRVIAQSGSALSPWAFNPNPKVVAAYYARNLRCPTWPTQLTKMCLLGLSSDRLVSPFPDLNDPFESLYYRPVAEAVKDNNTFLHSSPYELMELGKFKKVPTIFGVAHSEGAFKSSRYETLPEYADLLFSERWNELFPLLLGVPYNPKNTTIQKKFKDYFFPNALLNGDGQSFIQSSSGLKNLTDVLSLANFYLPLHRAVGYQLRKPTEDKEAPVFLYYFDYLSKFPLDLYRFLRSLKTEVKYTNVTPAIAQIVANIIEDYAKHAFQSFDTSELGAAHGEEILYLFDFFPLLEIRAGFSRYKFSYNLVKRMTDFAKGRKSPDWIPASKENGTCYRYLQIRRRKSRMVNEPFHAEVEFADPLIPNLHTT